jgi:hypothetical protein
MLLVLPGMKGCHFLTQKGAELSHGQSKIILPNISFTCAIVSHQKSSTYYFYGTMLGHL